MDHDPAPDARPGRHRRRGEALVTVRDHRAGPRSRLADLPRPSATALLGLLVLVLIAAGAIHLSTRGSAIPADGDGTAVVQEEPTGAGAASGSTGAGEASGRSTAGDASGAAAPTGGAASHPGAAGASTPGAVVVHVSGQVARPGVVELPAGARVDDAIAAAGGPGEDADLAAVNLARPLVDGEQIHVPAPGEAPPAAAAAPAAPAGTPDGDVDPAGGALIDLNTADAATLQELPGVGPALADRIIEHREANGPFADVAQLEEVPGIGPATLAKIAPMATV